MAGEAGANEAGANEAAVNEAGANEAANEAGDENAGIERAMMSDAETRSKAAGRQGVQKLAGRFRGSSIADTAREFQRSVIAQVWLAPAMLAIPLAWIELRPGNTSGPRTWLVWGLAIAASAFVIWHLYLKVAAWNAARQQHETPQELVSGGVPPVHADVLVTWVSLRKPAGDPADLVQAARQALREQLTNPENSIPKVREALGNPKVCLLVSSEVASSCGIPDAPVNRIHDAETLGLDDLAEMLVTIVDGGSLNDPEPQHLTVASQIAFEHARKAAGGPGTVVADLTAGTAPASVALYEAATEAGSFVTWWRREEPQALRALVSPVRQTP